MSKNSYVVKKILSLFIVIFFVGKSYAQNNINDEFDTSVQESAQSPLDQGAKTTGIDSTGGSDDLSATSDANNLSEVPTESGTTDALSETVDSANSTTENLSTTKDAPFDFLSETQAKPGEVIIESQTDLTTSYKKRRGKHGVLFSLNYEKFYPYDYYSLFRDGYIDQIFGTSEISLMGGEVGYKYNFTLGSIYVSANYAQGKESATVEKVERSLQFRKQGLSVGLALDNIMEEPWIVPYAQVGAHQFLVEETNGEESDSVTTGIAMNYRFGLLFQLNWLEQSIDPSTHTDGLRSSGLQNTYLDFYMVAHESSSELFNPNDATSTGDPDLKTELLYGLGIKMEF